MHDHARDRQLFGLEDVSKSYDGRSVLGISSLNIMRGEVLAIVGPSGAGKSTLLRLLNFLEPPTSGKIIFDDHPVPSDPPLNLLRRVTTVFQYPQLLSCSAADNVAYGLRIRGHSRVDVRVEEALAQVGLAEMAAVQARNLSGGEKQRVAMARALALEPEVLLLDEPTANLDPYNVRLIEELVAERNISHGTTIVLVSHNVFQARRLAQRCALLLEGQLIEVAESEAFFDAPFDDRVAAFVRGEMVY